MGILVAYQKIPENTAYVSNMDFKCLPFNKKQHRIQKNKWKWEDVYNGGKIKEKKIINK